MYHPQTEPPPRFQESPYQESSAGFGNLIVGVEGLEARPDADFVVRAHAVIAPAHAAGLDVEGRDVSAHAAFSTHHADDHLVAHHQRHRADCFARGEIGGLGAPDDFPILGVQRKDLAIQSAVEDLAVRVRQSARLRPATRGLDRGFHLRHLRPELPLDHAIAREIERVNVVGFRRDDVHRAADNQRGCFMRVENAELEAPRHGEVLDIRQIDLIQRAVVPAGIVAVGHHPLLRIGLHGNQTLMSNRNSRHAEESRKRKK